MVADVLQFGRWLDEDKSSKRYTFGLWYKDVETEDLTLDELMKELKNIKDFNDSFSINPFDVLGDSYCLDEDGLTYHIFIVVRFTKRVTIENSLAFKIKENIPLIWSGDIRRDKTEIWLRNVMRYIKREYGPDLFSLKSNACRLTDEEINQHDSKSSLHTSQSSMKHSDTSTSEDPIPKVRSKSQRSKTNPPKSNSKKIANLVSRPLPKIKIDKNSSKSRCNTHIDEATNYHETDLMMKCFYSEKHRIISGGDNIGKTSWAKFILDHKCIVVESFDDLKLFDHKRHIGIIFENIDFSDINSVNLRSFLSYEDRTLHFKDKDIFIPGSARMIFTTRQMDGMIFGDYKLRKSHYLSCFGAKLTYNTYKDEDSESGEFIMEE